MTTNTEQHTMKLASSEFESGMKLNTLYTVNGRDISPPLEWSNVPVGTKAFAILCEDPDAPSARHPAPEPWVHWVIFNIPADTTRLPPGIAKKLEPNEIPGVKQGRNSWAEHNVGYRGPAPPPGSGPHRYVFRIYALNSVLSLPAGATKTQLLAAMKEHVLDSDQLIAVFER